MASSSLRDSDPVAGTPITAHAVRKRIVQRTTKQVSAGQSRLEAARVSQGGYDVIYGARALNVHFSS